LNAHLELIVKKFVEKHFPESAVAFLYAPPVRKHTEKQPSLDLIIIDLTADRSFRERITKENVPIELYLYHDLDAFSEYVDYEIQQKRPRLLQAIDRGVILKGEQIGRQMKQAAQNRLNKGPTPLSREELDQTRYMISSYVEQFLQSNQSSEELYLVNHLFILLQQFVLKANNQWSQRGQWLIEELKQFNETLSKQYTETLAYFYLTRDKQRVVQFVDHILSPYGGRINHPSHQRKQVYG
jgi:hypothetical protein